MVKKIFAYLALALLLLLNNQSSISAPESPARKPDGRTGTMEKMIVGSGTVTINLNLDRLKGIRSEGQETKREIFSFEVDSNSFFTIRVFNKMLRGPDPGSMGLHLEKSRTLPDPLNGSGNQLVLEKIHSGGPYDLVVRDGRTGFVFFNVEGDVFDYDPDAHGLSMKDGRLLISEALANRLGHKVEAGVNVGEISISATVHPIEITEYVHGAPQSGKLPPRNRGASNVPNGAAAGPDIIVGVIPSVIQAGSSGGQVGLGIATTSCNNGDQEVHFFEFPDTDHSVISMDLYRMSGGTKNNDRLEQIGQGWAKHAFGANQDDDCGFGCTPAMGFTTLGVGCSDPYDAGENAIYTLLGSRAWINPFTGAFPSTGANHSGHTHNGTSHRLLVNASDLNTTTNTGATYYAEVAYDIRQEYEWCQAHPGQCNMYNNASYRQFNVSGTTSFTFLEIGETFKMTPAINAWTGATINMIEPEPGVDGRAFIAYKVTNPSVGVWHYEYAVYNRNLDRAIQSFGVPLGAGVAVSNIGFHAPENPAGFTNDGTLNDAGFSNAAWTSDQTATGLTWNSETLAQNQNANAIRWSTMYNFWFDSNTPPQDTNATVGFFKTGTPITVAIQAPVGGGVTPTPTPTATPGDFGTPSPTPPGIAQAINLSTRLQVGTGANVGIGGFIITGTVPKQVLLRGIGPSLSGIFSNALSDPLLELNGTGGFVTITNSNWKDTQETEIMATGIPPSNDLESAILVTLDPGSYTAILSGNGNTTGVGLVEVYDLTPVAASKMGNISTRAAVGTGNNIVIAGFILGNGGGADLIILRALGVGVPLLDPRLELRDSHGALIFADDNWQDDPGQAAIITAAGLAPNNPSDAAIAVSLSPGAYTSLLMGVNNSTGIGLMEVYDNPVAGPTPTATPEPTPCSGLLPCFTPTPTPTPTPSPTPGPTPTPGTCIENFDGVTAPALPANWVASNPQPGDGVMFVTTTITPDSAPNSAFIPDQDGISDKVLDRPNVTVNSASAMLSFRNNFDTEFSDGTFWDGGVLEISTPSISNGDFLDFTDPHVGASCLTGCYTGQLSGDATNPLASRLAWSGNSAGYIDTLINLGPSLNGQVVTLRFRFGSDEAVSAPGWHIDGLSIVGASCP